MGQSGSCPSLSPSTDFSRVNSLRPVSSRNRAEKPADTMYQSLRSYVGKNAKLPGYMDYLHLSTSDVGNLKESWSVLEDNVSKVGVEFFLDILNHHEEIKTSFKQNPGVAAYEIKANEDLYKHGLYVLAAIKKIISNIDDTDYLEKFFDDLSDKHRKAGVDASGMDVFGKVFCKVMRPILLEKKKWKPEVKDSWVTFFGSIVKVMKKNEMKVDNNQVEEDQDARPELRSHVFKRTQYDRHLMQVGCETFTQLFTRHPEVMDYLAEYDNIIVDGISIGETLRAHAIAVGSVVAEIQENAGNPERIRMSLAGAGQRRYLDGVERRQLDMLGPVLSQAIRPLVWQQGLWSSELEKAWTHLFDIVACLMKLGYPHEYQCEEESFPNLTEVILLKDTWPFIKDQITQLTVERFEMMFSLNADMSLYLPQLSGEDLTNANQAVKSSASDCINLLEQVVPSLPDINNVSSILTKYGQEQKERNVPVGVLDMIGPVFCNTTRPFLLVQGRWCLDVERSWLGLFKEIAAIMRTGYSSADL